MRGIYKITQKSTGLIYIGQSINIDNRWNQHANAIDNLSFHQEYRKNPLDFIFEILAENDNYTKDDLDRLEKQYITDYKSNDPKYGFNGTAGNGDGKKKTKSTKILPVQRKLVQVMFDSYVENRIKDKKVLIIGVFETIPEYLILKKCDVTILTDDFDYTCEDAKIIRFDGGDELMSKVKEIKKDEFDLIIANPPYNIGNKVIASFVDKAKESIVLAPISCYKSNNNYKHVRELQLVDPKAFKDAAITGNLNIATLINREIDQSWEEIELLTYDEKYRKYYSINISKINDKNKFKLTNKKEILDELVPGIDFIVPQKATNDGVHKTRDCIDYRFNFLHEKDSLINNKGTYSNIWVNNNIHDSTVCNNIIRFWYNNPLVDDLLFGLNSEYGDLNKAIPHINWSIDRDYEHCTLDDIMKWLEEDNK